MIENRQVITFKGLGNFDVTPRLELKSPTGRRSRINLSRPEAGTVVAEITDLPSTGLYTYRLWGERGGISGLRLGERADTSCSGDFTVTEQKQPGGTESEIAEATPPTQGGQLEPIAIFCDPKKTGSKFSNSADPNARGIYTAVGCIPTKDANEFIKWLLGWAIGIGGGVAFLLILFSGFQIMTASGKPEQLEHGREMLTAAVSGLIFIIFSVFLLRLIGVDILKIPGLT